MENISDKSSLHKQADAHHLSQKETRQIVTPYAFHVSPELFGTALAKPKKRAVAIGIDMLLIALLSQSASFVLAGVAAVTFFRAGNRLKLKKRFNAARLGLRFMAAVLLFVFALGLFEEFEGEDKVVQTNASITNGVNGLALAAISAKYMLAGGSLVDDVNTGKCQTAYQCWEKLGDEFVTALMEVALAQQQTTELTQAFLDMSEEQISAVEKQQLQSRWLSQIEASKQNIDTPTTQPKEVDYQVTGVQKTVDDVAAVQKMVDKLPADDEEKSKLGLIAWGKSLLEDMGLGFGWAALYFCIFTAWWKGQTPGKRLLGIKVIKLDGSTPTFWESFGRYGGYGAGFATGLLGFLQVYWDPNRQAIQDKISETLVIDLRIAKVNFIPEQNEPTGNKL